MAADKNPAGDTSSREVSKSDDYSTRLLKLLPAEITGAYLAVRVICNPESNTNDGWILFFATVILLIAPSFMRSVLGMKNWTQIIFLMFTYVVWIANFDIDRIARQIPALRSATSDFVTPFNNLDLLLNPVLIKGIAIVWLVLLVPFIIKPVTDQSSSPTEGENGATGGDPIATPEAKLTDPKPVSTITAIDSKSLAIG
jgi:hypothetical protein